MQSGTVIMVRFSFFVFLLVAVLFAHVLPYYMANKDEYTLRHRKKRATRF